MTPVFLEVSIVIPVHNEGPRPCRTLAAIREARDLSYEAIVVNDASTDSGCEFLRARSSPSENVVFVEMGRRNGVAHSRNLGAEPCWMDYEFWIRLAAAGARIQGVHGNHFFYRRHDNSLSQSSKAIEQELRKYLREKHASLYESG